MARLHECQGKALLRRFKIATPEGRVVATAAEAHAAAEEIGRPVMVKAQGRAGPLNT